MVWQERRERKRKRRIDGNKGKSLRKDSQLSHLIHSATRKHFSRQKTTKNKKKQHGSIYQRLPSARGEGVFFSIFFPPFFPFIFLGKVEVVAAAAVAHPSIQPAVRWLEEYTSVEGYRVYLSSTEKGMPGIYPPRYRYVYAGKL